LSSESASRSKKPLDTLHYLFVVDKIAALSGRNTPIHTSAMVCCMEHRALAAGI
jgi:hypothetical protein